MARSKSNPFRCEDLLYRKGYLGHALCLINIILISNTVIVNSFFIFIQTNNYIIQFFQFSGDNTKYDWKNFTFLKVIFKDDV